MDFAKIAPYLQDPLVLVGFVLLLFFGFGRALLKAGIIPVMTRNAGYRVVSRFLLYGFVLALVIIGLGFGLKYRELSQEEQRAAVRLLNAELAGDIEVSGELKRNTETILNATSTVSSVLRHPGIRLLSAFFPVSNLDPDADLPASLDLAREQLQNADGQGLLQNELERAKFQAAGAAISGTINRTLSTVESLADRSGNRYVISSTAWEANLPILRKVSIVDASKMSALYLDMARLRTNYGVVVVHCLNYLHALQAFFGASKDGVSAEALAEALAAERIFTTTAAVYMKSVEEKVRAVEFARQSLASVVTADLTTPAGQTQATPLGISENQ